LFRICSAISCPRLVEVFWGIIKSVSEGAEGLAFLCCFCTELKQACTTFLLFPLSYFLYFFFLKHEIVLSQVFLFRTFSASELGVLVHVNNVPVSDEYCVVSLIFLSPRGSKVN
jgi:hypothetical protein